MQNASSRCSITMAYFELILSCMETSTLRNSRKKMATLGRVLVALPFLVFGGCSRQKPSIVFTQVPGASFGGPNTSGAISGRVMGFKQGDRVVLYAHSGNRWWIQPISRMPFTKIKEDGTWTSMTHLGLEYAAVLVRGDYDADAVIFSLPDRNKHVIAKAIVPAASGSQLPSFSSKILHFSGYDWEVRAVSSPEGGLAHNYKPGNVWLDDKGAMHLRISREGTQWVCAEARTTRSLGYGSYQFMLETVQNMEPAATLGLFTRDENSTDMKYTEMDIHVSRWGNPETKNGEYVIQPYQVPSNVYRFEIPKGSVSTGFRWSPGSASFSTAHGASQNGKPVAVWTFNTGVPAPTGERTYINLCEFGFPKVPLEHGAEVVIDRFQFLP